ncbi:DNA-binding CsgD family transcriptional regulator/sugar-specific transcriptional regulator TrmB [Kitasatospora sp. MAP12-15]|uniref:helix-turn-helix transcriptional regulator n=1 Tax=unclassified Kitasatospora TaxID=2633591 RepID=UPI002476567F|nr:helix-turn-helix transcriptional regulator [Kitasatospora sp. MAP12-44]MDH6111685.1 DNA-binding CsgD family transcriptional regulator/sugar-specific transcriptional regulator TrmB [Kitasatospora sp. MAP12-44]
MLATLGLSEASEAVYRSMLAHPGDGVAALVQRLGLSESEIREALDSLSELSLLRPSHERQGELRAVSPDVGMELLMARQQHDLAAQQLRIEASRAAAAQLIAEYSDLRPTGSQAGVEQLIGLDAIRDRLTTLTREVRSEVLAFAPDGAQTEDNMKSSRPLNEDLLRRGVRMRTVYLDSLRNNPPTIAHANWLAERGGEVRTVPVLPTRMIVTDRNTAVIPVSSDDTAAGAVVLTGHGTLSALCALFESVWAGAQPLGEAAAPDARGLSGQEATAVRLLAEGLTDEAIAKRLGVSPRTARRLATELMERLGARSRFEAGVRAVQRGWLPSRA